MNEYELEQGPGGAETRTYFVIGESRTNADNAITKIYGSFYLAFEVSERTEQVVACWPCKSTVSGRSSTLFRRWCGFTSSA